MATRVAVSPALFRWAVERAGWDQETAHRRAPRLDGWLEGRQPTLNQLEDFAHATHTPLGLMFLAEPPHEEVPIPDLRTRGNQQVRRPSANLLETIYACQARQEWYRHYAAEHGLPEVSLVGSAPRLSDPVTLAAQVRSLLRFEVEDRAAARSMIEARRLLIDRIEELGILVMVSGIVGSDTGRVLDVDEFRGFALADSLAPVIFVNGADTRAAQLFTIAHELGHLLLGDSALSDATMASAAGPDAELWCNRFAAELLVPASRLRLEVPATEGGDGGDSFYIAALLRLSRRFATALISSALEGTTPYREALRLLATRKVATFEGLAEHLGVHVVPLGAPTQ